MDKATEKAKVLVVEDEADVRGLMVLHLRREGLETTSTENGEDALKLLRQNEFDLVVLDWMLPGVSGLEICKHLRATSEMPVLMVTARADTSDIVLGLEIGADDYITKPFEIPVFLARVRGLLRRMRSLSGARESGLVQPMKIGGLSLDPESHEVFCEDEEIDLTPSEFKLLKALMLNRGRVLSRERLIGMVQGEGIAVVDRTVDTHVFGLRKKLKNCADFIETIRGVGYRVKN